MGDVWSYEGKRVVIVGCGSGMGEATARELVRLGAEVHGADVKSSPVSLASFTTCDLRDPGSIDATIDAIGGPIDALFNCAGLPGQSFPPMDVMRVNFIGTRYWTERTLDLMAPGSAVVSISSTVAFRWMDGMDAVLELAATPTFDDAVAWCEARPDLVGEGYALSKQALILWTMHSARRLMERGIRINCTSPAPTATPMMVDFEKAAPPAAIDVFALPMGRRSTPDEQAWPLVFLNSDAAAYVSGQNLAIDGGFTGSVTTGQLDVMQLVQQALAPRA